MGCGSSSLKGDDVNVNAAPTPAPKRVNTNFASVDYSQEGNQGRRMTEYAPHETAKSKKSHDASGSGRPSEATDGRAGISHLNDDGALGPSGQGMDAAKSSYPHEDIGSVGPRGAAPDQVELKPYMTNDGWDNDDKTATSSNQQQASQVNGTHDSDPTSVGAKRHFAHENDPASVENQETRKQKAKNSQSLDPSSSVATSEDGEERKKSWLGEKYSKYHAAKTGKDVVLSDEELKKYTGKDRKELNEWAEGRKGVGENQVVGRVDGHYWGGAAGGASG
ncbi:uncharacterized protein A1O9_01824 [Exophiala aquamarina CBS 119918]|uniref:Uncharacterized protein n=1 Tax=Exophiala aquamarina CBS 119918 TaxID=1182545 RepID=A0A072PVF9_9EURO|nr:uncharacterized protein A1O9_01824 [Exophiala aquamarina CBS 119918]KEF63846.1 hypothetical protein A1O9_01824 [Exophiala aquamarina CBS 119918]